MFDQTWSEPTMEGITLELTFDGATLVQARMCPHIILDKAQPNFMDRAGSGKVVMSEVFVASRASCVVHIDAVGPAPPAITADRVHTTVGPMRWFRWAATFVDALVDQPRRSGWSASSWS